MGFGRNFNYYALTVAILANCTVETAFEKLNSECPGMVRAQINEQDIRDMSRFRSEGLTYSQIGEIYGMHKDAVYARLRRMPSG